MVRRGCLLGLFVFVAIVAVYFYVADRVLAIEWPGNAIGAVVGGLFASMGVGGLSNLFTGRRDMAAFARAAKRTPPEHGQLVVAAGPIRPLGAPLVSPIGGKPCVAYDYEVMPHETRTRGKKDPVRRDICGFAMAASAIDTPLGSVRVLGFPLLDEFPKRNDHGQPATERITRYLASTPFEAVSGVGVFQMLGALDNALADEDGAVRKDFRLEKGDIPFERRTLCETVVGVGEPVVALGRYDSEKRALVPKGTTLNRLWPGTPEAIKRRLRSTARTQAAMGLILFGISHGMIGFAIYQSENRHRSDPESYQAAVIRSAMQDGDVAALRLAVRRGANPNARDQSGDTAILDVRDPEMASALIALGADVNVRHAGDRDTPLIRAARMGIAPLVQVLLAAGADVHAEMADGATALSEAERGGHEDVMALLRGAAQRIESPVPVERPR